MVYAMQIEYPDCYQWVKSGNPCVPVSQQDLSGFPGAVRVISLCPADRVANWDKRPKPFQS